MGHDISDPTKFRSSSLYQRFEAEALLAVVAQEPIGADDITDLVMVNMKGPDYTGHAHGPSSPETRETLAELDRQMTALLATIERKAGPQRSVIVITADHGMPDEPPAGGRHYPEDIAALIEQKFDPTGQSGFLHYDDAANSQLYVDAARLQELGFSLKELAEFLESQPYIAAAFTEDEVRAAQAALPHP
jgi:predicted AlkP superfamily pyrophosphatase or phosphodiesterase